MTLSKLKIDLNKFDKEEILNFDDVLKDITIDLSVVPERPPLALSIGVDDKSYGGVHYPLKFGTFGNFSVLTGQEKSRKSWVKSLLEGCSCGGNSNNFTGDLDIRGQFQDKWIISIDSEQSEYDAWTNGIRVPNMVGHMPPMYKVLMLREKTRKERRQILEWLFMESEYKNDLGLCFLDGLVDFINDPNDQSECNDFIDLIMKYTSITKSHLCAILHLNPGSEKMRGHLGTIASQKAETVAMVKNLGEYSLVTCKSVRGGKPFKDFTIRVNEDWLPYISDDDTNAPQANNPLLL